MNLTFTKDKPPCPDVESEAVWVKFLGSGWGQFVRSGLGAGCEVRAGVPLMHISGLTERRGK